MPMENQNTPTVFESVAVAVVIVMYFCLGMYGYLLLAHFGFLIFSAWALFQKRRRIMAARRTFCLLGSIVFYCQSTGNGTFQPQIRNFQRES